MINRDYKFTEREPKSFDALVGYFYGLLCGILVALAFVQMT